MVADLLSRRSDLKEGVNINDDVIILPENLFVKLASSLTNKLFLENNTESQRSILKEIHDSPIGGHPGISNTWNLINCHYQGSKLCQFVENYVKGCAKC